VRQYRGDDGRPRTHEDQPHIHRLTRLGIVAAKQGRGIEFADEVSHLIWSGTENWHEADHLSKATDRAGLSLPELDGIVVQQPDQLDADIAANETAHEEAGHWGVPTCTFEGEPFFGQDRLDVLMWRLKNSGLQSR
jgi:2-hydroxychromene-2-carboxylate isomerase